MHTHIHTYIHARRVISENGVSDQDPDSERSRTSVVTCSTTEGGKITDRVIIYGSARVGIPTKKSQPKFDTNFTYAVNINNDPLP